MFASPFEGIPRHFKKYTRSQWRLDWLTNVGRMKTAVLKSGSYNNTSTWVEFGKTAHSMEEKQILANKQKRDSQHSSQMHKMHHKWTERELVVNQASSFPNCYCDFIFCYTFPVGTGVWHGGFRYQSELIYYPCSCKDVASLWRPMTSNPDAKYPLWVAWEQDVSETPHLCCRARGICERAEDYG